MFLKNLKKEKIKTNLKLGLRSIKKIPIPIAFLLTLLGLAGGVLLINQGQNFFSKAEGEKSPQQIKITNIESTSFVVSWITDSETTGEISLGETASTSVTKKDIREESSAISQNYLTHFILVDNLKADTKYYFKIISGAKTYTQSGKPYEITTAPEKSALSNDIAQGRILTGEGGPATGSIVYFSLPNTITQASLAEENGYWMILLSRSRTSDLQNYSPYDQTAQIAEILVQAGNQTATAILTTGNDNPSPDIVLGQTYDFVKQPNAATPTQSVQTNPVGNSSSGFQSIKEDEEVTIDYPSNNEQVNSQLPEFFGAGPKGKVLKITVESSEKIDDEANVDTEGEWQWSPDQPLAPGSHTITVSYVDSEGFLKEVSRNFVVLAAENSNLPAFTATGSATTVTPTTKVSPSVSPTPSSKITPTIKVTVTATPSATTSATLTPTRTNVTIVPTGTAYRSGSSLPSSAMIGIGGILILIGAGLLLL